MITSPDNQHLKTIRGLRARRQRDKTGLFVAEGEDLVDAAAAAGVVPELLLRGGVDVEAPLLDAAGTLGSGTRVIGVYRQRWADPGGELSVYLEGVSDPGNVGAIIRSAHALGDGPVLLGPGCADPYSPKAVRATMGSVFARPPACASFAKLKGFRVALAVGAPLELSDVEARAPAVLCVGSERDGLPPEVLAGVDAIASIATRADGPQSLGVAAAAAIGLRDLASRMADDA